MSNNFKKAFIIICGIIIISCIILIVYVSVESSKFGEYIEGDYSKYYCQYCEYDDKKIPADGGVQYWGSSSASDYYCKEHFAEQKRQHEEFEKEIAGTEKCEWCGKRFKNGTDDARYIIRTNFCESCYTFYKGAQKALGN